MIPELFKDSEWATLLAMADPALDPLGEQGAGVRRTVNWILFSMYADVQERGAAPDPTRSFAAYAIAGEHFIRGMRALDSFRASGEIFSAYWDMRPARETKRSFDADLARRIEELCALFRRLDEFETAIQGHDVRVGPNSKPWLHVAVHCLYDLWRDELGQGKRPKKDFLAFAFAVLEPTRLGITENSVLESFDRHVKPFEDFRRRVRQTGPV